LSAFPVLVLYYVMNDYLLSIRLIDIASFVFLFGGIFISNKVSKRIGKPFLRILFGLERRAMIELTTPKEKIFIILLFVNLFFLSYLVAHDIKTIANVVTAVLTR